MISNGSMTVRFKQVNKKDITRNETRICLVGMRSGGKQSKQWGV